MPTERKPENVATREARDVRYGHDLSEIQDENGVDLALLRKHRKLTVEERFRRLEQQIRFAEALRAANRRP